LGKICVAIIGVGAIALAAHIPNYVLDDEVEIVGFVDPEVDRVRGLAKEFADKYNRPEPSVYADMQSLLASERVDAVSICTPNNSHVKLALQALDAGLHVLVEKPMSVSLEDANALVERAQSSAKVVMVGMSHRYRQDVEVLRRFVEAGDLGEIYYAKARILRRRGTPKGWFTDQAISGGGPLLDIGVHALDLAWWLMGSPQAQAVSGYLRKGIGQDHLDFINTWTALSQGNQDNSIYSTEDFATAMIRFKNGCVMQLEVSWTLNGAEDDALKVDFFGTKGGVSLDPLCFYGSHHGVLTSTSSSVGMGPLYAREIGHFLDCVRTGKKPISDATQGRDIVAILNAITRSSAEGREVTIE